MFLHPPPSSEREEITLVIFFGGPFGVSVEVADSLLLITTALSRSAASAVRFRVRICPIAGQHFVPLRCSAGTRDQGPGNRDEGLGTKECWRKQNRPVPRPFRVLCEMGGKPKTSCGASRVCLTAGARAPSFSRSSRNERETSTLRPPEDSAASQKVPTKKSAARGSPLAATGLTFNRICSLL